MLLWLEIQRRTLQIIGAVIFMFQFSSVVLPPQTAACLIELQKFLHQINEKVCRVLTFSSGNYAFRDKLSKVCRGEVERIFFCFWKY